MVPSQPERGVDRLLRQQAALASFGSYAFREKVLLNVLNEAARVCAEGLDVPFSKICRYRPAENDLLIEAGYGWNVGVVGLVVSRADETSPQGRAFVTGKPVILGDIRTAADVVLPPFYVEHHVVSTVDVVIKSIDGDPYGVLEIDSPVAQVYDERDINFLTGFANILAEAVATVTRADILRQTVAKMQEVVAEKDHLLRERMVMAEELKHRVRNNLQLVAGMLTAHLQNQTSLQDKASIGAVVRRVMTLAGVYEQLLGTGLSRSVDLGQYLAALCESLPDLQVNQNAEMVLTCEACALLVDLDTVTALGMVVAELVSNSYEHSLPNVRGTIQVTLARRADAPYAVLTVRDNGAGFVEQPGSKRHGVGLVRRLVQQVQGTAVMTSDSGTTWTIGFPVKPQLGNFDDRDRPAA